MEKREKRSGYALLAVLAMLAFIFVFSAGAVFYLRAQGDVIALRAARLQRVVLAVTEVLTRQLVVYSGAVNEYYRALEDENLLDGEKEGLKSAALARWFDREELEAQNVYAYEEVREKFGATRFRTVDEALNSSLLEIGRFDLSIPEEDAVYDLSGFLIAGRLVVEIEMEEGSALSVLWRGRKKYGKGVGARSDVTEMWSKDGVAVTIPIKVEGDGKNFWTD
jgi:hypothetical protein